MVFGGSTVGGKTMGSVVDRIVPPKDDYAIIPVTCKYITWHGKRDFADETKGFETGRLFWIIWVGQSNHEYLKAENLFQLG